MGTRRYSNDRKGVIVMEPVIRAMRDTAREPTPENVLGKEEE